MVCRPPPPQSVTESQTSRWPISSAAEASVTLTCDTANRWPRKAASSSSLRCLWACSLNWLRRNCCRRSVRKRTRGDRKSANTPVHGGQQWAAGSSAQPECKKSHPVKTILQKSFCYLHLFNSYLCTYFFCLFLCILHHVYILLLIDFSLFLRRVYGFIE